MKLTLEKPVYGGDCIARLGGQQNSGGATGKRVFVPFTLPGETVEARVVEDKRVFARAELEAVLDASPDRVPPLCPHFGTCGGCQYQHANYAAQLILKQQILRETLQRAKVAVPAEIKTLAADPWHYRNRIRLAISSTGEAGYRGRASHEIVPIRECPIAAPILVEAGLNLSSFLDQSTLSTGLNEVELFVNHDSSELLLSLYRDNAEQTILGFRVIAREGSSLPHIEPSEKASLTYTVAGQPYRVDGGAFFQVNRNLLDRFVDTITADLAGSSAWDLYAGVGLFARRLAGSFAKVTAVESAPTSSEALRYNLAPVGAEVHAFTTLDYLRRNREQREPRPDLILLDPPRAGLGDEVTHLLNAIGAPELVYVSCDPATLARDLHALTRERYRIESLHLADMFPHTFHLETIARLRRT